MLAVLPLWLSWAPGATGSPPTAAPTVTASLTNCFYEDEAGGDVLKQTIGKTAAMVAEQNGSDPTQEAMETCGWRFAHGTRLHFFCPDSPYTGRSWVSDYSAHCTVIPSPLDGVDPDPMVMVYHTGDRRGVVSFTLPGGGYCRFRLKFAESYIDVESDNPGTLALADNVVWAGNSSSTACATVVSGAFAPGDALTFTERSIIHLWWLELVPEGSPQCEMVPAEVTASACCGDCPVPLAPTAAPTVTASLTNCFYEDEAGGDVLKQTIGKTAAMAAQTGSDPTPQAMATLVHRPDAQAWRGHVRRGWRRNQRIHGHPGGGGGGRQRPGRRWIYGRCAIC